MREILTDMYMSFSFSRLPESLHCLLSKSRSHQCLLSEFHWECVKVLPRLMLTGFSFCSREIEWCTKKMLKSSVVKYKILNSLFYDPCLHEVNKSKLLDKNESARIGNISFLAKYWSWDCKLFIFYNYMPWTISCQFAARPIFEYQWVSAF